MGKTRTNQPLVCLLREPTVPDPYEQALEVAGFRSVSVPVLRFKFVNQDALVAALATPATFAGLILTSPRSVSALAQVWSRETGEQAAWRRKPVFVVGPRTAESVRHLGLKPVGEETGQAASLVERISHQSFSAPLLFLSGNRRRDELPYHLSITGTSVQEICVYETHVRKELALDTLPPFDWLVFFSPSGVEAVQRSGFDVRSIHKAAIGPTTAEAIAAAGWQVAAIASAPTPHALVVACRNAR